MSPRRKTPQSNIRAKRVQLSENTAIPHSSLEEESQEGMNKRMFQSSYVSLAASIFIRMKVTVDDGTERFSVSVSHEATEQRPPIDDLKPSLNSSTFFSSLQSTSRTTLSKPHSAASSKPSISAIASADYNPYGVVQIDAGYSFTLTWLEKPGEWSYKLSSLGTLERIALNWMKQDIRQHEHVPSVLRADIKHHH
ncbi:hypothetical protein C2845_PM08G09560 [Panicum miliaceum]|uniref:DUF7806 domain-containing protein n=1 Tax=Panicum miliaceum TaxID=4540 RepID=A0A3L6QWN1_PANMI|nr:hypothetical protein C2845_PM08G09560 [Panicum miliaceum]